MFKSDEEKREFLQIKPDDDELICSMKTELLMVMDMTPEEKQRFYQVKRVAEEEHNLQWMIDSNRRDDELIKYATAKAHKYGHDIQSIGEEPAWLEALEQWVEIAKGTKANKFSIADIRKQREIVWKQKRKLKQMTKPATEQSHS